MDFNDIKQYYAWGWQDSDVAEMVTFGIITSAQYKEITGKDLEEAK